MQNDDVLVKMERENLEEIPCFALLSDYAIRPYQPGDERVWRGIQAAADHYNVITPELFAQQFGEDQQQIAARQLYLCDARNAAVGTATAWFNDDYRGKSFGRVHWVAILPDWQGLGLAKPLLTATLQLLRKLGHKRAYLTTSTARIPAINLYLQFGFVPQLDNTGDLRIWRELLNRIDKPGILPSEILT